MSLLRTTLAPLFLLLASPLGAATIWAAGAPGIRTVEFSKAGFDDPNLVFDPISPAVTLTRANDRGLYNLALENAYIDDVSPAGTEWAFAGLDGNPSIIGAADFAALNFTDWRNALGSRFALMGNIVDRPGVLHLIDEDIYLELTFTAFGGPASGGSFTYLRTTGPIPEPSVLLLLACSSAFLARRQRAGLATNSSDRSYKTYIF